MAKTADADTLTIAVSLKHGDLRHAAYPLAVGHYRQDVIVSAEAALNEALDDVLRQRFDLGRYPGPIGTFAIVRHGGRPKGAIVVGLGDVGDLTAERLRESFAVALKEYALAVASDPQVSDAPGGQVRSAAFSTLLVGSDGNAAGTLTDSIYAILRAAVDTNRALKDAKLLNAVRIDAIEFIELYADVATRAGHVIADLPGILKRELRPQEDLAGKATVEAVPGGRYFRPADPYESGWWQRIGVQQKIADSDRGRPAADTATQLKFTVLTDRARLEQDITTGQRALVQQLISDATSRTTVDNELSATLYQLLVPASVRDRISQAGDVLFMLDRVGAGFPFELMASRGADGEFHPLIERHGILRQFETEQYDAQPVMARSKRIFVIGNPTTLLYPDLPGAEAEATMVEKLARKHSVEVTCPSKDDPEGIITTLMTGEFQIVHIAAHGTYDPDPMKSGVVIGDRLFLTPAEVARLPKVPELVFLNCCYLATIGAAQSVQDPRLAASLAEGFIRAGVRAIIAAGWAVDDKAGVTFAKEFYTNVFSGMTFGDAVTNARRQTATQHRKSNTWGAYQCYGNPDYRFNRERQTSARGAQVSIVTRDEAAQALRTLASNARAMRVDDVPWLTDKFTNTFDSIPATWRSDGELLTVAGEINGELGLFDKAIGYYRDAVKSQQASVPFVAIEQLANLLARNAATTAVGTGVTDAIRKDFQEAEDWLTWLDAKLPATKERRSLRGSLYKRMAVVFPDQRLDYLKKAAASYGVDVATFPEYQSLNALAFGFVLADAAHLEALAAQANRFWTDRANQPAPDDLDFWGVVNAPDTLLHRLALNHSFDAASLETLTALYADAWRAQPSPRQWASVTDHVLFLQVMTGDASLPCCDAPTSDSLKTLYAALVAHKF